MNTLETIIVVLLVVILIATAITSPRETLAFGKAIIGSVVKLYSMVRK
jgi:hypothetical protein